MGTHIFWRLVWKEYRQQRDLMIAMGVIALMFFGVMLAWGYLENRSVETVGYYHIAFMLSAFYALGCGATLFAGEHERETFSWLRSLPQGRGQTYWAKLFAGAATVLAVLTILSVLALAITRNIPVQSPDQSLGAVIYLFTVAEIFAWAVLFSLLLRQPLWAVAVAGLAYFAVLVILGIVGSAFWSNQNDSVFLATRGVLLVGLWTANAWLGVRWLTWENGFTWATTAVRERETTTVARQLPKWLTIFTRLTWQWWRESRYLLLASYGLIALMTIWLVLIKGEPRYVLAFLPALVGSCLFFNDQWKQQQRFFAEHGVSGSAIWWSRIVAGLLCGVPWLLLVLVLRSYAGELARYPEQRFENVLVFSQGLLPLGLLLFAVGQFCSLRFRAGILGVFAGICLSVMMLFWIAALRFLGIPDWLGIYPLALVLLVTSWFYASDWLIERDSWKQWLRQAAIVVAPLLLYLGSIAAHRAYEIPNVVGSQVVAGPTATPIPEAIASAHREGLAKLTRPASQEALTTARLYRELATELAAIPTPTPAGGAMMGGAAGGPAEMSGAASPETATEEATPFIEGSGMMAGDVLVEFTEEWHQQAVAKVLERFVEVSRRDDCDFMPDPVSLGSAELYQLPRSFQAAVDKNSDVLAEQGKIEQAIELNLAMLRFARHFQQRGDLTRVATAIDIEANAYNALYDLAHRYLSIDDARKLNKTLKTEPYRYDPDFDVAWMRDYVLSYSLAELDPWTWQKTGWANTEPRVYSLLRYLPWERERSQRWINYQATGVTANAADKQSQLWPANTLMGSRYIPTPSHIAQLQTTQARNRAAIEVRLQLLAWQEEHGHWPKSLEEVADSTQGTLPLDPATQRAFVYRPHGFRPAALASEVATVDLPGVGEAFLWSPSYHTMRGSPMSHPAVYSLAYQRILQGTEEEADQVMWKLGTFYRLGRSTDAADAALDSTSHGNSPSEGGEQND